MASEVSISRAAIILRRFRNKCEGEVEEITGLNITAMMDMMTILMVFLLKSFAVSAGMIVPSEADLSLPKAATSAKPGDFLVVTVTKQAVLVEGEFVVGISTARGDDFEKLVSNSWEVGELKKIMDEIGQINELNARADGKENFERQMLLVADKETPYYVIVAVVFTAAQAKYAKYQMVVISQTAE
jgi:biopolymer transport protein ExbD